MAAQKSIIGGHAYKEQELDAKKQVDVAQRRLDEALRSKASPTEIQLLKDRLKAANNKRSKFAQYHSDQLGSNTQSGAK